jgi:hypothetical protein
MNAEGWYLDPFHLHEARWFSDGVPTALVRDGGVEGHDAPPEAAFTGTPEEVAGEEAADGGDLRRAGDRDPADQIFDPNSAVAE